VPFAWFVALRYLRDARGQTALILSAVAVGVAVVVFLSALINGLQASLIDKTLGTQAHITLHTPREVPRPIVLATRTLAIARVVQPASQRLRSIDGWSGVVTDVERLAGIIAMSPMVTGFGFAVRSEAKEAIAIRGVIPERLLAIIDIRKRMVAGLFDVTGDSVVIGSTLAQALDARVGEKIHIVTTEGADEAATISGIFTVGNEGANKAWVITSLRHAQSLYGLPGGATALEVKVADVFNAEGVARALHERTGLEADSWMKQNAELLSGLTAQNNSKLLIQFFVILAVALGITSVLAVSVVQKSREIGILRGVGTPSRRVLAVFLIQGGVLGLIGSFIGSGMGAILAKLFEALGRSANGEPQFPVTLSLSLFVSASMLATSVGLLAAVIPAIRASHIDPATAIRNG